MKQIHFFLISLTVASLFACGKNTEITQNNPKNISEAEQLLSFFEKTGDLINSVKSPFTIGADEVYEEAGTTLVIDIRDTTDYYSGHIDGALWVNPKELPVFLEEKVNVSAWKKIVIACYSGQSSAYYVALLRLAGYSNLFTLRYGMAGWSRKIQPNRILMNLSNRHAAIMETQSHEPGKKYELPLLQTGEAGPYRILNTRIKLLFEQGFGPAHMKIDSLLKNPSSYFIVNYWLDEDYKKGHLPGAYQFTPRESLHKDKLLSYLPTDKPIAVYCSNGQFSAAVVAYLRVLGYDATSVSFGTNGFAYGFMQANKISSFSPVENIADYPLITGKNPGSETEQKAVSEISAKEDSKPKIVPIKKKQKTSGGGC